MLLLFFFLSSVLVLFLLHGQPGVVRAAQAHKDEVVIFSISALSLFPHSCTQRPFISRSPASARLLSSFLQSPSSLSLSLTPPLSSFFFSLVSTGPSSLLSGHPLQFPGHSGGAGEADVQHAGWRPGRLVRIPSCLPLLPHPVGWDGPACVDGHLHRGSQGTPAQRTAQVRPGVEAWSVLLVLNMLSKSDLSLIFWQLRISSLFIR